MKGSMPTKINNYAFTMRRMFTHVLNYIVLTFLALHALSLNVQCVCMGASPVCISGIVCMHRKHNSCYRSSMGAAIFPNFDQTLAVLYLPAFA